MNTWHKYILIIGVLFSPPTWAAEEKTNLFTLTYAQAEAAVSAALSEKGAAEKVAAFINGRQNADFYAYSKPITVEARGIQFDKASNHWSANLLVIAENNVVTAMPAAGRFDVLTEIPVLKRTVKNGDVIEASDIEIRDIAEGQVRSDTITDMASLLGKSPAYTISANRPIREHEVATPPIIKRNGLVQMHYRAPGMEITTSGQAMEDGNKGEMIKVKNLASKKIVQTLVEDVGNVSVIRPPEQRVEITDKPSLGDLYATN